MRFLLDTHVLLWWLNDPGLLSQEAREAVQHASHDVFVSAAVVWEVASRAKHVLA